MDLGAGGRGASELTRRSQIVSARSGGRPRTFSTRTTSVRTSLVAVAVSACEFSRRSRGARTIRNGGDHVSQPPQISKRGAKVVPPLRDAVRLVDGDQRDAVAEPTYEQ